MGYFSGLGIGLSFVFGCILMGLVAELYYLLWWKKKLANTNSISSSSSSSREMKPELSFLFCWGKPNTFSNSSQELTSSVRNHHETQDLEIGGTANKELGLICEEGIEAELMRVHNLCGPPRFLFTIKEESKEDLESDDGKSRKGSRTRSLSDLVIAVDDKISTAPFLTPLSSPTLRSLDSFNHHGINPLFESIPEAELSRLRSSSPPPKFKFLRDAEDKLLRRRMQEVAERKMGIDFQDSKKLDLDLDEAKCGSFVKFLDVREQIHIQATQVLPLPSSPTTFHHSASGEINHHL